VKEIFAAFSTVNQDLKKHLVAHGDSGTNGPAAILTEDNRIEGCIFFPTGSSSAPVMATPSTNVLTAGLREAESRVIAGDARWADGVDAIETALRATGAGQSHPETVPAHFAASAIRACLGHEQAGRAATILGAALKFEPGDGELLYLGRIMQREHPELFKQ
jgi:hypothetical protein